MTNKKATPTASVDSECKPKVLSIGEIIWDVYPDRRLIGGAPLNFAAHLAACGVSSSLLSGVGEDALGADALERIKGFGIDPRFVDVNSAPTGCCTVTLDAAGVPSYRLARDTAYDATALDDACIDRIAREGFDAVAFGTLIQRSAPLRARIRELLRRVRFDTVFCDVNLRPDCFDADSARFCLESAHILKLSAEEEPTLRALGLYGVAGDTPESVARAICAAYPNIRELLLTDGAVGAYHFDPASESLTFEPAVSVKVVSTVGAGDSFGAAYLASRLLGGSVPTALDAAVRRSAFVVAHADAVPIEK